MISESPAHRHPPACANVQRSLEHRFDDESCALPEEAVERHLAMCPQCAAHEGELLRIRGMLRSLPRNSFPLDALQEVLDQTVDRPTATSPLFVLRRHAMNLALAAVLMLAAVGAWFATNGGEMTHGHSEAELARLERDLNEIMLRLGSTLRDTERIAIGEVLIEDAAEPLRSSPFLPPTK